MRPALQAASAFLRRAGPAPGSLPAGERWRLADIVEALDAVDRVDGGGRHIFRRPAENASRLATEHELHGDGQNWFAPGHLGARVASSLRLPCRGHSKAARWGIDPPHSARPPSA